MIDRPWASFDDWWEIDGRWVIDDKAQAKVAWSAARAALVDEATTGLRLQVAGRVRSVER